MDYQIKIVQDSINYIESNLLEDINLNDISKYANISLSHLYRLFSLFTGMTIKEYIRIRRMTKAAIELRCSDISIIDLSIKYGFGSQEAFLRVFCRLFGITPGEYRKTGRALALMEKKDILRDFIHKAAHDSLNAGIFKALNVNIYTIYKPSHKWIAKINRENWPDFYEQCHKCGIMKIIDNLPGDGRHGGGIISDNHYNMLTSYGKEVPEDYQGEVPEFCEVFNVPSSKYIVFNHPPYPTEDHGSVIHSVYNTSYSFNPEDYGYKWASQDLPTYNDDDKFGFTLMRPVVEL